MTGSDPKQFPADDPPDAFERFQKFARALFRVDKRDVPKHEPKKRAEKSSSAEPLR
jgi:hypothetical protein